MKWSAFLLIVFFTHSPAVAQKNRLHVLMYKYDKGDQQRVSTSTYRNFTTTSPVYNNSVYGETAFDVYEEIQDDKEDLYKIACTFELTRLTHNGENFTYKMARMFKDDALRFTFDRYGVVDTASVTYENASGTTKSMIAGQTGIVKNFFVPLPNYPVKVGDKWNVTEYYSFDYIRSLIHDVRMTNPVIKGSYTLESVDRNQATISLDMEIGGKGELAEAEASLEVEFFILAKGVFVMNIAEGKLISGSLNADVAGLGELNKSEVEFRGSQTTSFNVEVIE